MLLPSIGKALKSTVSWKDVDNDALWSPSSSLMMRSQSGVTVTPTKAMGLSAYWACGRNIAEDMAKCPLILYREVNSSGDRERAKDHPIYDLLRYQFNPTISAMNGKESLFFNAVFWHGGFCEIQRDGNDTPVALNPIHPSRVVRVVEDDKSVWWDVYSNDISKPTNVVTIPDRDMFAIHGVGPEGDAGYSMLEVGLQVIGLGLAMQEFSSSFYRNGTHLSGVLKTPSNKLKPEERENLRNDWKRLYQGPANQHSVAVLVDGLEFQPLSMPLDQAQFIETHKLSEAQICQLTRMPPEKIGFRERAQGWSTLEMLNADYVTDTLLPWDVRIAQEVRRKLLNESERRDHFAETEFKALMRGSSESRANYYQKRYQMKSLTPNEIRRLENENSLGPDGDKVMADAPKAAFGGDNGSEEREPPNPPKPPPRRAASLDPVIHDAAERCARKEVKAVNRASGKDGFDTWKDKFYVEQEGFMFLSFRPVAIAYGVVLDEVRQACETYCKERIESLNPGTTLKEEGTIDLLMDQIGSLMGE